MEHLWTISEQRAERSGFGAEATRHSYLHAVRAAFHPHSIYCSLDHMREQFDAKNKTAPWRYLPIDWAWNDGMADAVEQRASQMGIVSDDFLSILLWDTHAHQPVTWHCPVSQADEQGPRAFLDMLGEFAAVRWPRIT